jgi:hypothetical protein
VPSFYAASALVVIDESEEQKHNPGAEPDLSISDLDYIAAC